MQKKSNRKWKFTTREARAVLLLIPFIAVIIWILWSVGRPRFDDSATLLADTLAEEARSGEGHSPSHGKTTAGQQGDDAGSGAATTASGRDVESKPELFRFDPNTVTYEELRQLGVAKSSAAGIIKYRQSGKVFRIPEDFATCYGITDSAYAALKPYIFICEEFALKQRPENIRQPAGNTAEFRDDADVENAGEPRSDAVSNDATMSGVTALVELNTADSAALVAVRGIGPRSAQEIIAYRDRLGGYHRTEQLLELKVILEKNYEVMRKQIWADSCEIQKIDINFASPNAVAGHPYMAGKVARRILKNRQMKGGWSTIEDMTADNTLSSEEAARLAPYLQFTAQPRQQ